MSRAFLVIDIQNDYFAGGILPLWQADETEARLIAAIDRARAAGDRVILIQHVSAGATGLFATGAPGTALRPAILAAAAGAPIVTKATADAFQNTDLRTHLGGIDELLVGGMMTQNCVVFTALSRLADDFRMAVVADLCTAPTEMVHLIALSALRSKTSVIDAATAWP